MIENLTEVIQNYLIEEDYKILHVDEESGDIRIRYQMTEVCISSNKSVPNFISIIIPSFDTLNEDDFLTSIIRCIRFVTTQMVVKVYPVDKETIIATYEFFFNNEDDLFFQISHGLDCLMEFSHRYRLTKRREEEEAAKNAEKSKVEDNNDWEEIGGNDDQDNDDED